MGKGVWIESESGRFVVLVLNLKRILITIMSVGKVFLNFWVWKEEIVEYGLYI